MKRNRPFALRVHPAGLALLAAAILTGHGLQAVLALAALLIHEGFHVGAALLLGARIRRIELTPFGGVADVESFQSLPASWQVCIAVAGPVGSLFVYSAVRLLSPQGGHWARLGDMSLMLGLFNLLPMLPLDGARALGALGDRFAWGGGIRRTMLGLAFCAALVMLAAAAYGAWHGHINITLLFAAPYLCYAARQAHMTQRGRLVEERLRMSRKLRGGGAWRVDGTALPAGAGRHELLRQLLRLPGGRLHYFFLVNPETGKVERILEESEAIGEILGNGGE